MKGQKRSVFLRFLQYFLTFAVGNGITKNFFGLVIQLPRRKNKIPAAKLQMFFDFAIEIRSFLFDNVANYYTLGLKVQKKSARGKA